MNDGDLARLKILAEIRAEAQAKVDAAYAEQWQIIHALTQEDYPRGMPVKLAEAGHGLGAPFLIQAKREARFLSGREPGLVARALGMIGTVKPYFLAHETIHAGLSPEHAIEAVRLSLASDGYRPQIKEQTIVVRQGSDLVTRLFGLMLAAGRNAVPVGLTVTVEGTTDGSHVRLEAYDRLGPYLDKKTSKRLAAIVDERMQRLIQSAKKNIQSQ